MPLYTATPARIRRVRRESEFARVSTPAILTVRPDAQDGFSSVRESWFDSTADAQVLLNEAATVVMVERRHEAIEATEMFRLGVDVALTPALPRARLIDRESAFDRTMMIKGISYDLGIERNSIEVIG